MHILGNKPLGAAQLLGLFKIAEILRYYYYDSVGGADYLKHFLAEHAIALLFFEPSTGTRTSFQIAARSLGAEVLYPEDWQTLSTAREETLEDIIRTLAAYPQLSAIVLRHPERGAAEKAAKTLSRLRARQLTQHPICIINAGDGPNWHPTQAYTDLYTLWRRGKIEQQKRLEGMILGDLAHASTIHSFILESSVFRPKLYLIGLETNNISWRLFRQSAVNGARIRKFKRIKEWMAQKADFCYFVRLQKECLPDANPEEKERLEKEYSAEYGCSSYLRRNAQRDAIFLHPGPMCSEMKATAKWDNRLAYDEQVENGMWIRAALLITLLSPKHAQGLMEQNNRPSSKR